MKTLITISLILTTVICKAEQVNYTKLINILKMVESSNNPNAIGDYGRAFGILQITKGYVKDFNRIYKKSYTHQDMFNTKISTLVTLGYLIHYGNLYTISTHKVATYEILARIHNGGPYGYKKQDTIKYWNKIKKVL